MIVFGWVLSDMVSAQAYLTDIYGSSPRELTTGSHGMALSVVFSPDGKLVAWLEQAKDGAGAEK